MPDRHDRDWEELAQREAYFAVLTDERFLRERLSEEARSAFFASGDADVERLLALAEIAPRRALDFGCGVGRLTLALAKRIEEVVGFDVSPTMLGVARANVPNARFVDSLDGLAPFDLIVSLIVFQHIPVARGEELLRRLLVLLAPGGVAALHVTFRRPGGALRRIARRVRARSRVVHRLGQWLARDERRLPYMQMNEYDEERVRRIVAESGCDEPRFVPMRQNEIEGAIVIARKRW